MMKRLAFGGLILVLLCLTVAPISAQTRVYTSPHDLLQAYYTAISTGDYRAAYDLWLEPPANFNTFADGFSDTYKVEPYFGSLQQVMGNNAGGAVSSALAAYHYDGTVALYYGCFYVVQSAARDAARDAARNNAWLISAASLYLSDQPVTLENISAYLSMNCATEQLAIPTQPRVGYSILNPEPQMLRYYFGLINTRDFASAYAMWLAPLPGPQPNGGPPRDYRRPYQQFVKGYDDTAYIMVYTGVYEFGGAAAGKPYLQGRIPTVLIAQKTDGTFETYNGCFVLGLLPSGDLGIVNGKFDLVAEYVIRGDEILTLISAPCRTDFAF